MQDFVNGRTFPPFSEEPTRSEVRGYHLRKFLKSPASQSPSKNCRAAAVGRNATRRRVSRIVLASVVNASSCRRRALTFNAWCNYMYSEPVTVTDRLMELAQKTLLSNSHTDVTIVGTATIINWLNDYCCNVLYTYGGDIRLVRTKDRDEWNKRLVNYSDRLRQQRLQTACRLMKAATAARLES